MAELTNEEYAEIIKKQDTRLSELEKEVEWERENKWGFVCYLKDVTMGKITPEQLRMIFNEWIESNQWETPRIEKPVPDSTAELEKENRELRESLG